MNNLSYFSTFISGTSQIVKDALKAHVPKVKINMLFDGLLVWEGPLSPTQAANLRFFNSNFLLIDSLKEPSKVKASETLAQSPNLEKYLNQTHFAKKTRFRLIFSQQNRFLSIGPEIINPLKNKLETHPRLIYTQSKANLEFWFLARREEGYIFFGPKIRQRPTQKQAGELKAELAYLLCFMSNPQTSDIILDPFCGYGVIPVELAKNFPVKKILAGDIDPKMVNLTRQRARKAKARITEGRWDATLLKTFEDDSIDKIITDPPWGQYQAKHLNIATFYAQILSSFYRILKKEGTVTLLTGQKTTLDTLLKQQSRKFRLLKKHDILVSGQKAAIFLFQKK